MTGVEGMKDSFVFYKSFYDAIKQIPEEYQLELYNAILQYSLEGIEPSNLSNIANAMFTLIKPNIDSSQSRYESSVENGKKGGAPIGNQNARKQPKNNLETTQKQPKNNLNDNVNVNDNDNDNVNDNVNDNEDVKVIKKENKESFDTLIDNYTTNDELRIELKNHLATRKAKKATLTNRAIELSLKKLDELVKSVPVNEQEGMKLKIVRQSIERGWTGFFPIQENKKNDGWDYIKQESQRYKKQDLPF